MTVRVTVAPSPKRQKHLRVDESQYLVALAAQIAEDHPETPVTARYGHHRDDVMTLHRADKDSGDDIELF